MKLELFDAEAKNIWKKAAGESRFEQLQFELSFHKKLFNLFQVGDYCYFVFNIASSNLEVISKEIETLLGYRASAFDLNILLDNTHPDDRPYFLNFENKAAQFLADVPIEKLMLYKMRYDYRIKKANGEYIRILQQSVVLEHGDNGDIIRTLATFTDISHLKTEGKPVFSIIGLEGEPSYINVDVEKVFSVSKELLSKREKQVLLHIIEGKPSKEICVILSISKQTVDNHRKNILKKANLNNTAELVNKAIKQGWI